MAVYARIVEGVVQEIIQPAYKDNGDEWPIEERYTPEMVAQMVNITDINPMPGEYWTYDGEHFTPYQPPVPSDAEISSANAFELLTKSKLATAQKSALTNRISTLQDAVDNIGVEGMEDYAATPAEQAELPKRKTQLTQWKNYAIALGRVTGQSGWALKVTWPAQPKDGMDLTVSPAAISSTSS